jgi:hypothetical protein
VADLLPYPGTPRWVRMSGIIALVLILLVGFMLLTGLGGHHGPRRHTPFLGGPGGRTTPSGITAGRTPEVTLRRNNRTIT